MRRYTAVSIYLANETPVSFRRKETYEPTSSVLHGGQVSKPYKCQGSSAASYAGVRLYRSAEMLNEVLGKLQSISDCRNAQSDKGKEDYSA